ncbi:MAG: hypothetical protein ABR936_13365 [Bacteroidota bacterium]|jgi:hypothetical protein
MANNLFRNLILFFATSVCIGFAQVKPKVSLIGGDDVPALKQKFTETLETILLELNRVNKGKSDLNALKNYFSEESFRLLEQYVTQNHPYTARKQYSPQVIEREHGQYFDIRSIAMTVDLGETEASPTQNLIFTFSKQGTVTSFRSMLPNCDYERMISEGLSSLDSLTRGRVLDFMEQFRMAYNAKDTTFLEKVYSDEALIIVGTVLRQKGQPDDFSRMTILKEDKVKLVQQSKRDYINGLKKNAFKNSFLNVRFEDVKVLQHEKIPELYGISCKQYWNSSKYSDQGYLFLMMDYRKPDTPVIHVRSWQPQPFDDGSVVGLYDFDVVGYSK